MIDMDFDHMDKINQLASESFDGQIESHTMLFYGICGECSKKILTMWLIQNKKFIKNS